MGRSFGIKSVLNRIERRGNLFLVIFIIKIAFLLIVHFNPSFRELLKLNKAYQIQAIELYLVSNITVVVSRFFIVFIYLKQRHDRPYQTDNFILGLRWISSFLNFVVFMVSLFLFFEIDYKALFTSLSIIAAAIAILSKDYISNMINGMIILFTNHVSLGDNVKIGDHRGKIVDVNLMNVHLQNEDDDLVLIPNQIMLTQHVINYTKRAVNRVNIEFEVSYDYLENVGQLEEYLIGIVEPYSEYIEHKSHFLRTAELKKDTALFHFQYTLKMPDKTIERRIRRAVLRNIVKYISNKRNNAPK